MATIDTEDAARRLARVILSDIDLYMRERPKAGESREAQIEEGRRLFASRVTPELVPVFDMVLADRAAGIVNAPTPAPSIVAPAPEDQPPPAAVPEAPAVPADVPAAPLVTSPAPDPPGPVQPARVAIRRMLAIASVLAVVGAVLHRFLR